ncbi:MAG TPA: glycerol-3-phosphate dehydrogenase/oxidase [Anaeromyxobacteraceae bacterium]|nr:glycerol-3-phosphate dehydrogenase/oxidase [Anaeromyxobacteraceae bacterium]
MGKGGLRDAGLARLAGQVFDVLVLGGGINGAVAAAALSTRGASVALVERGDFASETSQASSCLVWGGIKYLETLEVGLVRRLCRARNELLRAYPSSVREVRFYAAHERTFRHARAKLVAGTWLYWALGGGFTAPPRPRSLDDMAREEPLVARDLLDGGFEYSDAWLPDGDARFVWGFVRAALDHGCAAVNYAEALGSRRGGGGWLTRVRDAVTGRELEIRSRLLVNACGPWADGVNARDGVATAHRHVLSKGIHLVVDRLTGSGRVLAFFADDGRLFFAIPLGHRTCIGTTDTPAERPDEGVTAEDRRFVLDNVNKRLRLERPLGEGDVVAERCGVRPLVVDAAGPGGRDWVQLSRRHVIEASEEARRVTVFGGKLTDCLNVGEELCREAARLGVALPHAARAWYGEPPAAERDDFQRQARALGLDAPGSAGGEAPSDRLWRRHGREAFALLEAIRRDPRAGEPLLGPGGCLRCEVEAAGRRELVVRLEDFLRRRTSLALVERREDLRRDPGLEEACRLLFGEQAAARRAEYFGEAPAGP